MENKPTTKRYPPELKERAVRLVHELREHDPHDKTVISRVARQLGVDRTPAEVEAEYRLRSQAGVA